MSRVFVARIAIGAIGLLGFCLFWSLAYEIVVAWRWNPSLPSEGTSRWSLLQYQNARRDLSGLFVAWDHFRQRLSYQPTQAETIMRGLIAAAGTLAIGAGLVAVSLLNRKPRHLGDARFGSIVDAERKGLMAKEGLLLGRLGGATLRSDDPSHVLVVGPTRSGKGVSFVIPNGYTWRGSSVWFDPKRENFEAFAAHRQALGDKVYFFSPGERDTHRYNPLDFIRRDARMPTDAAVVSSFIIPEATGSSEIWARAGRQLLTAMIGYVLTSPRYEGQRHLRAVTLLLSTGVDFLRVLTNIRNDEEKYLPPWVVQGLNQFIALEKETRNSAYFNLTAALNPWTNDLVAAATATTDFDISVLRKEPAALFIGCSIAQLDVFRPVIKILVQQIHDVLMASLPGPDEPYKVLVMIDEFRQLGKMEALVSKLTINAGYGFRMVLILQDLAQLDEVYGKPTRLTTLSACQVKLFIRVSDLETAEYVSGMLGSMTLEVRTPIIRAGQGLLGGRDKSVSYHERRLRTPAELLQMPAERAIALVPNAPGFLVRKVAYYKDSPFKATHQQYRHRRLKVPALEGWRDLPLRSMAEVEAAARVATAVPFELGEPGREFDRAARKAACANATPIEKGPTRLGIPGERKPQASGQESDAPPPRPKFGRRPVPAPTEVTEAETPAPKPRHNLGTVQETSNGSPLLARRSTDYAAAPAKTKASMLQFQTRAGNKAMSIDALLASIDQEVEAGADDIEPTVCDEVDEPTATAVTVLQGKIRRHGDRWVPPPAA